MDKVLKFRLSAQTKAKDKQLARTQALLLDAVGPLSFILEEASKGQLPPKAALEAAQTALYLLGNASANISRERRRTAIANMNSSLVDMAEMTICLIKQHQTSLVTVLQRRPKSVMKN